MKKKPSYPKIRFPKIPKAGGAHAVVKGGKYRRILEKEKIRKQVNTELS